MGCVMKITKEYIGRMLEISVPPKEGLSQGPKHCWMRIRGQLRVCDLEEYQFAAPSQDRRIL